MIKRKEYAMNVNINFMICVILELDWVVVTYNITETPVRGEDASFKSTKAVA